MPAVCLFLPISKHALQSPFVYAIYLAGSQRAHDCNLTSDAIESTLSLTHVFFSFFLAFRFSVGDIFFCYSLVRIFLSSATRVYRDARSFVRNLTINGAKDPIFTRVNWYALFYHTIRLLLLLLFFFVLSFSAFFSPFKAQFAWLSASREEILLRDRMSRCATRSVEICNSGAFVTDSKPRGWLYETSKK